MSISRLTLLVTLSSVTMLIAMTMLAPTTNQAFAATSVDYRTHVSLQCYTSGTGEGNFELLKNGKVIGRATLTCSGYFDKSDAYPVTEGKPLEWRLILKLYDSSGNTLSSKTSGGKGFPSSSSLSGSLFGNIDSPARYYY